MENYLIWIGSKQNRTDMKPNVSNLIKNVDRNFIKYR